tara:strand:- start:285 stop:530 length:246 start_codon:yes stop_codon:yes gene_type:complete
VIWVPIFLPKHFSFKQKKNFFLLEFAVAKVAFFKTACGSKKKCIMCWRPSKCTLYASGLNDKTGGFRPTKINGTMRYALPS